MPPTDSSATAGLVLGIILLVVDGLLFAWLWRERSTRSSLLSEEDAHYFRNQDLRRGAVVVILLLLAIGLAAGSRVPSVVNAQPNRLFIRLWAGVVGLILVLVILAFVDWISTRFYARRRRLELLEEGFTLIEEQRKIRLRERLGRTGENGHPGPRA